MKFEDSIKEVNFLYMVESYEMIHSTQADTQML